MIVRLLTALAYGAHLPHLHCKRTQCGASVGLGLGTLLCNYSTGIPRNDIIVLSAP
jgi:hypothetical protein